jgi:hypothetical protein
MTTISTDFEALRKRLHQLGLFGLLGQDNALLSEPWVESLISIEQNERQRRSLLRRLRDAKLGVFKPLADFDCRCIVCCVCIHYSSNFLTILDRRQKLLPTLSSCPRPSASAHRQGQ